MLAFFHSIGWYLGNCKASIWGLYRIGSLKKGLPFNLKKSLTTNYIPTKF